MSAENMEAENADAAVAAPIVGLVMGSDSDWPVMEAAADAWQNSASLSKPTSSQPTACPRK
ncbi:phosphoribosylaminoimidazole carboxylase, catalytic subunit [Arthrobacter sp. Hiyo1]|nr:phosphoribosylaminoimidazole carboxylase, catalytic subunit [Arthrobacter sp. Hiyo1]